MEHPVELEGFNGRRIVLRTAGLLRGPMLYVDGEPAPKGPKRRQALLRRSDGTQLVVAIKPRFLGLDVPRLVVAGREVAVVPPLGIAAWIWSALPVLLLLTGGVLGAVAGLAAFSANIRIFRSSRSAAARYGLTAVVSAAATAIYVAAAVLLLRALNK